MLGGPIHVITTCSNTRQPGCLHYISCVYASTSVCPFYRSTQLLAIPVVPQDDDPTGTFMGFDLTSIALACLALPCLALLHRVLSCLVLSCLVLSYLILVWPHLTSPYLTLPCLALFTPPRPT